MTFDDKTILIVGGTGSFGFAFLQHLLESQPGIRKILIMSRDEQKQYELATVLSPSAKSKIDLFVGDVRDKDRVMEVVHRANIVVHAAALKHVPIAEANILECLKTNVLGTQNLVEAALYHEVEHLIALSTDKAVMPINSYGASKLYLERLIVGAQENPKNNNSKFSVVRYANVLGSRGSVVPYFMKVRESGELPITDLRMTRFSINMAEAVDLVSFALRHAQGGEIFIPKAPSYKITTVAEAVAPQCVLKEVGLRPGEKLSELMVSRFEAPRTVELEDCYIVPLTTDHGRYWKSEYNGKSVATDFEYDSATNVKWLSVDELRSQIKTLELR